jgi:hypothetical protein
MQIDGYLNDECARHTEVSQHGEWSEVINTFGTAALDTLGPNAASILSQPWSASTIFSAATVGSSADNPTSPYGMTYQQQARTVMVMFEQVSCFQVRYAITACCTTGKLLALASVSPLSTCRSVCVSAARRCESPPRALSRACCGAARRCESPHRERPLARVRVVALPCSVGKLTLCDTRPPRRS